MMLTRFLRRFTSAIALAGAVIAASASGASAQAGATLLGTFNDWGAYSATANGARVCYALSQPQRRLPEELRRGAGYIFVSFRPDENVRNEVAVVMGFPTQDGQEAVATVDGTRFSMVTSGENVWIKDPADEGRLVDAFLAGSELRLEVVSGRGNQTTDVYSLIGFTAALRRAREECS
jgi:invasion protein IalB